MRSHFTILAFVLTLIMYDRALCGEPEYGVSAQQGFLQRVHPAGGWNPYGGGLLHWWNPNCFACQAGPDNYCRKPIPCMCWPTYPPYYIWGPQELDYPRNHSLRDFNKPH